MEEESWRVTASIRWICCQLTICCAKTSGTCRRPSAGSSPTDQASRRRRYESGTFPASSPEAGALGLLGMHLEGYGCAGTNATSYGLACLELEAGDSGIRSLVSVQGSLAMFAIWRWASEEQKQTWLPRMAAGDAIGCFGLTEPDFGSNPAGMRTRARRDGADWVLDGTKMWITNGSVADVAVVWAQTDDGVRGFLVPPAPLGSQRPRSGQAVAPGLGHVRAGLRRRTAAGVAVLP